MQWTVRFFLHRHHAWEEWQTMATSNGNLGPAAYAARKAAMWRDMAQDADYSFVNTNSLYRRLLI
jgi:hypothetical protein